MPDLKSVKIKKKDRKPREFKPPEYPYGLEIRLDSDTMDNIGMDSLPEVDSEMSLIAKVKVTGVSSNEHSGDGEKHKSVSLQITEMLLDKSGKKVKDAAKSLYGD